MLAAIGLQESQFKHRWQIGGPARGFWQFERAGIKGVLRHSATKDLAAQVCGVLRIPCDTATCYTAAAFNDPLACVFARLLLWTLPDRLPQRHEPERGWEQYLAAWRPGKPHFHTWNAVYEQAWGIIEEARRA